MRSYGHITASATTRSLDRPRPKPIGYKEVETPWGSRPPPDSIRSYLQYIIPHHPRRRPPLPHFSNKKLVMYSYNSRFAPRFRML